MSREGTFSAYDDLLVTYVNDDTHALHCIGGEIHLERFQGGAAGTHMTQGEQSDRGHSEYIAVE
jgi:hypothetical protein